MFKMLETEAAFITPNNQLNKYAFVASSTELQKICRRFVAECVHCITYA